LLTKALHCLYSQDSLWWHANFHPELVPACRNAQRCQEPISTEPFCTISVAYGTVMHSLVYFLPVLVYFWLGQSQTASGPDQKAS